MITRVKFSVQGQIEQRYFSGKQVSVERKLEIELYQSDDHISLEVSTEEDGQVLKIEHFPEGSDK